MKLLHLQLRIVLHLVCQVKGLLVLVLQIPFRPAQSEPRCIEILPQGLVPETEQVQILFLFDLLHGRNLLLFNQPLQLLLNLLQHLLHFQCFVIVPLHLSHSLRILYLLL